MGKKTDLVTILAIVIVGMFIPFFGSIIIAFGLDFTNFDDLMKIGSTFGWFLLIFAFELVAVLIYYKVMNKIANKRLKENKPK